MLNVPIALAGENGDVLAEWMAIFPKAWTLWNAAIAPPPPAKTRMVIFRADIFVNECQVLATKRILDLVNADAVWVVWIDRFCTCDVPLVTHTQGQYDVIKGPGCARYSRRALKNMAMHFGENITDWSTTLDVIEINFSKRDMLRLPIDASWNIIWDSGAKRYVSSSKAIRVTYPKGDVASAAGVHFRACPPGKFPATNVSVSYEVFFPEDWDFVLGGKLPGVWGGDPGAGGGDWNARGWSARIMFREKGEAVAYLYMATDQGSYDGTSSNPLVKHQGPGFADIAHHTNGAGIDLWRGQGLAFHKNTWNTVVLTVKSNTPGSNDGSVSLTINGKTRTFDRVCWSKAGMPIAGLNFASWMGGGSKDYAPKKTQWAEFRNFVITSSK